MDDSQNFIEAAVHAPIENLLTYETSENIKRGESLFVPLGARKVRAVALGPTKNAKNTKYKIKKIIEKDSERPQLNEEFVSWIEWVSKYYIHPMGSIFQMCFPPLKKKSNRSNLKKPPVIPKVQKEDFKEFTLDQKNCFESIARNKTFQVHLIHGVTGSGKTEVYMRLLNEVLSEGKKGLVLVPEISLTPQLIRRFASHFPDEIAVIHSHLTDREKTDQWWSIVSGDKKILIGARSALFCPVENLGLILIDEEHETSFKQEEQLKYHARDAAIVLAQKYNIPIVLGSATPSLETWQNQICGKYQIHEMKSRVEKRAFPQIKVIDLKTQDEKKEREDLPFWLSATLYESIEENLNRKEQSALFLNRRGVASSLVCSGCGHNCECPNCAISLTLHGKSYLTCHYCEYSEKLESLCPNCKEFEMLSVGLGTEKIEKDLEKLFPKARIARADRDEIHSRASLEKLITQMEANEIDILIGTQMIAKGLDFPKLTLVGLVLADIGFNLPNFRSAEKAYQLITQMSGRSGRHKEDGGSVIIQTYNPNHPSILYSKNENCTDFYEKEMEFRKTLLYPPFSRLASIRWSGSNLKKVEELSQKIKVRAQNLKNKYSEYENIQVLGPAPAPLSKLRNKFRFHALIKGDKPTVLNQFCRQLVGDKKFIPTQTKILIDIDPVSMM